MSISGLLAAYWNTVPSDTFASRDTSAVVIPTYPRVANSSLIAALIRARFSAFARSRRPVGGVAWGARDGAAAEVAVVGLSWWGVWALMVVQKIEDRSVGARQLNGNSLLHKKLSALRG